MALSLAALLPHSPLLIPDIGRSNYHFLSKTKTAYQALGDKLQTAKIDTIIIISPHGSEEPDHFSISVSPDMKPDFKDFGFISDQTLFPGDPILADQIKNALKTDFPIKLNSPARLDYGSGVPLYLLKEFIPQAKALVIHPAAGRDLKTQAEFGSRLYGLIAQRHKKIAVIASGDLSHRLKKKSPGGYSPKGAKFDNKIIELISDGPTGQSDILSLDPRLIAEAGECGLRPLVMILGLLSGLNWQAEILAYQTDFGVGYLSVDFRF